MKSNSPMVEFVVYILYSRKYGKTYCGQTGNLISRFRDHNELGKKGWSKNYRPWEVIYVELCDTRQDATKREKYFKTGVGRDFISEIIKSIASE